METSFFYKSFLNFVFFDIFIFLFNFWGNVILGTTILITVYLFKGREKHLSVSRDLVMRIYYLIFFFLLFITIFFAYFYIRFEPLFYFSLFNFVNDFLLFLLSLISFVFIILFTTSKWDNMSLKNKKIFFVFASVLISFITLFLVNIVTYIEVTEGIHKNFGLFAFFKENEVLLPAFLLEFFTSLALGGLWVAVWGTMKMNKNPEQGRWQYRSGATFFASSALLLIFLILFRLSVNRVPLFTFFNFLMMLFSVLIIALLVSSLVFALIGMNSIKPSFYLKIASILFLIDLFFIFLLKAQMLKIVLQEKNFKVAIPFINPLIFIFLFVLIFIFISFCDFLKRIRREF